MLTAVYWDRENFDVTNYALAGGAYLLRAAAIQMKRYQSVDQDTVNRVAELYAEMGCRLGAYDRGIGVLDSQLAEMRRLEASAIDILTQLGFKEEEMYKLPSQDAA